MTAKPADRPDPMGPPSRERAQRQRNLAQVYLDRAEKTLIRAGAGVKGLSIAAATAERDSCLHLRDKWQAVLDQYEQDYDEREALTSIEAPAAPTTKT